MRPTGISFYVTISQPGALLGTWVAGWIEPDILKVVLGVGLFAVALSFLRAPEHKDVVRMAEAIQQEYGGEKAETCLVTAEGEQVCYTVCNRTEGRLIAGVGGLFVGMVSSKASTRAGRTERLLSLATLSCAQ